jgi:PAS domain S-box-containing protein
MATRTDSKCLRAILKSNVLAMGCWKLGGHITANNGALIHLIGYTNKELKDGRIRMRDITPPEYQPLDLVALNEARAAGECSPFEKEVVHNRRSAGSHPWSDDEGIKGNTGRSPPMRLRDAALRSTFDLLVGAAS